MKALLIDDEISCLEYLEAICKEIEELEIVGKFMDTEYAMKFIRTHEVELILLDIQMPRINGIEFAKQIKEINENIGIILVTAYEEYALEAFKIDALAYILKPSDPQKIRKAVQKAKKLIEPYKKRIFIRTFGRFDVFIDGQPLHFSNAKAKEMLALLVDREGGIVTMEQVITNLWEERAYDESVKQLYRKAVIYTHQILKEKDIKIFVSNRGSCYVKTETFECDYYNLLKGKADTMRNFQGEYMFGYPWGENTLGKIYRYLNLKKE